MSFNFGLQKTNVTTVGTTSPPAQSLFSFGNKPATTTTSTNAVKPPTFGTNFQATAPATNAAPSLNFSQGSNVNKGLTLAPQPGTTPASTPSFLLPSASGTSDQAASAAVSMSGGFSLPSSTSTAPSGFALPQTSSTQSGFSIPLSTSSAPVATSAFSLATTSSTAPTAFSLVTTSAPPTGFSLPTSAPSITTTTAAAGFNFTSTTTAASTAFNFGTNTPPKTDSNKVNFSMPSASTTTATPLQSTTATSITTTPSTGFSLAAPASSASVSIPAPATMSYSQIEDLLNKWTTELAEQEKVFQTQVTQVNTWDKLLADNSSKLMKLHSTVEKVQQQQKKINYDLDLILAQKKELENALAPLEKEYSSASYHPDVQREKMYHMAENIDAQIKKMSEDVKETIEHVNESARSEKMHPIVLIGRVLNAQMNSLQWIDENSAHLQSQIESMSKYLDSIKRENDRSSYIAYP